jgi:3-methyl-2-oxobutanoate hydroxymethyltransferase
VLVMHDLLGLSENPPPKFVPSYAALAGTVREAFQSYADEVKRGLYPDPQHCYAPAGHPNA